MYKDLDELKDKHIGSLTRLWTIYNSDNHFFNGSYFLFSLLISIIIVDASFLVNIDDIKLILKISSISLSILPNLLGFNLGAYILVVGFGGETILSQIIEPLKEQKKFSLYQKLNGVLGISVVIQIICLLFIFFINVGFETIELSLSTGFAWEKILLCLVIFASIFPILLLMSVIKQVFIFAQTIHFCLICNKISKGIIKFGSEIDDKEEEIEQ